ncbi:hypothetical protein ACFLFF_06895 [Brevibacillus reuszeri]|uniref:hypothetical protein n=1 Tax=Brevibacillus reuszeri TaxID=54915 RepID=UPI001FD504A5|nr:hypothetical protein [Brevibacillus reuszeri]
MIQMLLPKLELQIVQALQEWERVYELDSIFDRRFTRTCWMDITVLNHSRRESE